MKDFVINPIISTHSYRKARQELFIRLRINNISSKIKIDYHGQLIDKKDNPVWYVFPWEDWW